MKIRREKKGKRTWKESEKKRINIEIKVNDNE